MTFKVLKEFEAETPQGTLMLKEGQKVRLSKAEAIPLIQDGLIQPIERAVYRIYSEILQGFIYVVNTDADMHTLRGQGVTEAVYTEKVIHKAKEIFPESTIKEIKKNAEL